MTPKEFTHYLEEACSLAKRLDNEPAAKETLFQLIDREQMRCASHPHWHAFFQGEHAFYLGNYENALKQYLEAKSIPQFQFFCYRASACLQDSLGARDKAVSFAEKATKINSEDPSVQKIIKGTVSTQSLKVLASLFEAKGHNEELFAREFPQEPHLETIMKPQSNNCPATANKEHSSNIAAILQQRMSSFQQAQTQMMNHYTERFVNRTPPADHSLFVLHGWNQQKTTATSLLTERSRKSTGGFFLRWNGKGIVINPGHHFLENFHQKGLHIKDIDYVIMTQDSPDSYADVKEIYDLNAQLNKVSTAPQIINYYVNPRAYQKLSQTLKPHYKHERNTLHRLEIFVDSPEVEKIELSDGISLSYFPITSPAFLHTSEFKGEEQSLAASSLGICLDLASHHESLRLGYVSGGSWSPLLSHHLGNCDVLIAGFGSIGSGDFNKGNNHHDGLGYFGTFSLLEEVAPKLLLCCEFSGREGDIRIETVGKIRQEIGNANNTNKGMTTVLPGDHALLIDLKTMQVRCSLTGTLVPPSQVKVTKSQDMFGSLSFLSPDCCLA